MKRVKKSKEKIGTGSIKSMHFRPTYISEKNHRKIKVKLRACTFKVIELMC